MGEYVVFCEAPFVLTETGKADVLPKSPSGYKMTMDSFNPVAIRLMQHEVHAPEHTNWGVVTCHICFEEFAFGPNRIYGVRGNKTAHDYENILKSILSDDHTTGREHYNSYDLGE